MQGPPTPTEDDEGPNLNHAFTEHRRAAKRTLPWDLPADELELVSPPQAEETQATKRPRLERPFSTSADEATTKNTSHDTTVVLPSSDAAADHHHADSDLLTSGEASPVAESTSEEDFPPQQQPTSVDGDASAQNSGVPPRQQPQYPIHPHPPQPQMQQMQMPFSMPRQGNYCGGQMSMHPWQQRGPTGPHPGYFPGQYMLPQQIPGPGMYQRQMYPRMPSMPSYLGMPNMPPNMMLASGGMPYYPGQGGQMPYPQYVYEDDARATGAPEEDAKLTNVVTNSSEKKRGKEYSTGWAATAVLVPGQTLHSSIDQVHWRTGKWTPDEDTKLKDAVRIHDGKNWNAIAALVPGRTRIQCIRRWHDVLDPRIDRTPGRSRWTADEDTKLKDAVQTAHGVKNWDAFADGMMSWIPALTGRLGVLDGLRTKTPS
jgi:hypothetical protein